MAKKSIALQLDPTKKMKKVDFMNTIATVVQIMHTDPNIGSIEIQIYEKKKLKKSYRITVL